MAGVILALSITGTRRVKEIGALAGALGAIALATAGFYGIRAAASKEGSSPGQLATLAAGVLLLVAFVLEIIGLHFG